LDRCKVCTGLLYKKQTIFAANGFLYCSEACCRQDTEDFEGSAEEIATSSIGIVPPILKNK